MFKNLILSFSKSLLLIVKTMDNKGNDFELFWNFFMGKQILPWVNLLTIFSNTKASGMFKHSTSQPERVKNQYSSPKHERLKNDHPMEKPIVRGALLKV